MTAAEVSRLTDAEDIDKCIERTEQEQKGKRGHCGQVGFDYMDC